MGCQEINAEAYNASAYFVVVSKPKTQVLIMLASGERNEGSQVSHFSVRTAFFKPKRLDLLSSALYGFYGCKVCKFTTVKENI